MKNKTFRKILSFMLLFMLTISNFHVNSTFAASNDVSKTNLIQGVESLLYNSDLSYTNITLGNSIPTYIIEDDIIKISEVQSYPLLDNNTVIGFISSYSKNNSTPSITFTTAYNKILNDFINSYSEIALIGNGKDFIVISKYSSSALIGNNFNFTQSDIIQYATIKKYSDINITKSNSRSNKASVISANGNGLSVPIKKQQNPYICWAACVASVGQYKTGLNKDSLYVAQTLGNTGGGTIIDISNALSLIYNLKSTAYSGSFYFNNLKTQIDSNKPVIGGFVSSSSGHAVVLSGYNSSSSSASFAYMDPWDGAMYTSNIIQDGNFTFTSGGYVYSLVNWDQLN